MSRGIEEKQECLEMNLRGRREILVVLSKDLQEFSKKS
jgi:hypothetical protein